MALTIAAIQGKGGTGKTTTVINLAGALREQGHTVRIGDLDPQRAALEWLNGEGVLAGCGAPMDPDSAKAQYAELAQAADFVILDTPPTLVSREPMVAAALADLLIVPSLAGAQEYKRADQTLRSVELFEKPFRMLAVQIDRREVISREAPLVLAERGPTFDTAISRAVAMREAVYVNQWIGEYAPESICHREFRALAGEVLQVLEEING